MNDRQRRAMFAKLRFQGVTIPTSWNTEDFQTRADTLSGAGVDIDKPFWKKQIDKNFFVNWDKIPQVDKRKLAKKIKEWDDEQYQLEKEREEYH